MRIQLECTGPDNLTLIDFAKTDQEALSFVNTAGENVTAVTLASASDASESDVLINTFNMEWEQRDSKTEIRFTGTGGALKGQEGNPGVVLNGDQVSVNLLLKRPDGSFYISSSSTFVMLVAKPLSDGQPDLDSLKCYKFSTGGVKLDTGSWHSVPFPLPGGGPIQLIEKVAASNNNDVVNVAETSGEPISVHIA